ncbi:MAG: PAS domain-containing protein [Chlorobiales bacterium]|nr:PAS domain-containing protein [Chlorobiales bacterium]
MVKKNISSGSNRSDDTVSALLEFLPDAAYLLDTQGEIINANTLFAAQFGKQLQECIGANIYDLIENVLQIPELAAYHREKSEEVLRTGKKIVFADKRDVRKVSINPLRIAEGDVQKLFITIQNISEQRRTQKELQKERELKTALLDTMQCSAIIFDGNLRMIVWNKYAKDMLFRREDTDDLNVQASDFPFPDEMCTLRKKITETIDSGIEDSRELKVHPHGAPEPRWLLTRTSRISIDGKPCALFIGVDITERKQIELELKESKIRSSYALDAAHSGIWEWNAKTDELSWSEQVWKLYGLKVNSARLNNQLCVDTILPEDREKASWIIRNALSNGSAASLEYRTCHPDGSVHWLTSRGMPVRDDNGQVTRYIGTIIDITERKQIETELIESRNMLTQALEATRAGIWEWDLKTGVNSWSDETWHLYGLDKSNEQPSFQLWASTIHPEDREMTIRTVENISHNEIALNLEYRIIHPDNSVHWLMSRGMPLYDEGGHAVRYIGTVINITTRKSLEEQLIESHARFSFMLEKSKLGGWDLDLKDKTAHHTLIHDRIFGYESLLPEWTYQMFIDHVLPEDQNEVERSFQSAVENGSEWNFECRIRRTDGEIRWIWAVGGFHHDHAGKVNRMSGIVTDITERKLLEEERASLQVQLHQAQKMQMVGQLAGGIAHDFNNMLMVILGHTELALYRNDSSYEDLKVIEKAATHSAELTGQLLAFARRQTVSVQIFDLNDSIEKMLSILRRLIGEHITIIWTPKVQNALVKLDPSQIDQILANLCVNSRDAISGNGTITIETSAIHVDKARINAGHPCAKPGDYITLSITDNGHGIDTQHLPHIIEPFFTTKDVGKGTGMGLATVYGIVKQGRGCINVKSEKGKGTTFIIYLPLQREQTLPVDGTIEEPVLPQGKGMILLVEDQPDILQLCSKILEHKGYTVLAASSPLEAIQHAEQKRENIDLLVTDVIMPEMNGSVLFKKIKPICPKLHVLYMSGYTTDFITQHLQSDGEVNFIEKPFSITEFTKTVQEMLKNELS